MVHYKNRQVLNKVFKAGYLDDLQAKQVSAVINVGNFAFTKRLNTETRKVLTIVMIVLCQKQKNRTSIVSIRSHEFPEECGK
jgi:hypothetical protein